MNKCMLCKSKLKNTIKYGEFIQDNKNNISVHYFCLLLTSNLVQRGNDDEGIYGFLISDIRKEAHRIRNQKCFYCQGKSANIGCCQSRCRRIFHMVCGLENGALSEFAQTFRSYCFRDIPENRIKKPPSNESCSICLEKVKEHEICCIAPCCQNGWFHQNCLQEFAAKAGYFFKCPLCNNDKIFRKKLVYQGIFIPDQDAAWELEPNAFSELLERPNSCLALQCKCKMGRKFTDSNKYKLIYCNTCGSCGTHDACFAGSTRLYDCAECLEIINNGNLTKKLTESVDEDDIILNVDENSDDESDCINDVVVARAFRDSIVNHPLASDTEDFEDIANKSGISSNTIHSTCEIDLSTDAQLSDEIMNKSKISKYKRKRIESSLSDLNTTPTDDDKKINRTRQSSAKRNSTIEKHDEPISVRVLRPRSKSIYGYLSGCVKLQSPSSLSNSPSIPETIQRPGRSKKRLRSLLSSSSPNSESIPPSILNLRDLSNSSLSSANIQLRKKNIITLNSNAKLKQTPINRNKSSELPRSKKRSHFVPLKDYDDDTVDRLTSSSSSSSSSNLFSGSTTSSCIPLNKLQRRLLRSRSIAVAGVDSSSSSFSGSTTSSCIPLNKLQRRLLRSRSIAVAGVDSSSSSFSGSTTSSCIPLNKLQRRLIRSKSTGSYRSGSIPLRRSTRILNQSSNCTSSDHSIKKPATKPRIYSVSSLSSSSSTSTSAASSSSASSAVACSNSSDNKSANKKRYQNKNDKEFNQTTDSDNDPLSFEYWLNQSSKSSHNNSNKSNKNTNNNNDNSKIQNNAKKFSKYCGSKNFMDIDFNHLNYDVRKYFIPVENNQFRLVEHNPLRS